MVYFATVAFDTTSLRPGMFRASPVSGGGHSSRLATSASSIDTSVLFLSYLFNHLRLQLCPLLTATGPSHRLSTALALYRADRQLSPGMAHPPPRLSPPHLQHDFPSKFWTLMILAFSSPTGCLEAILIHRCSVLPLASFRLSLAAHALAFRLALPLAECAADLNRQVSVPCWAHRKNADRFPCQR